MPGLDLPQLTTPEEEWRYAPNSQHGHLADHIGNSQESGEVFLMRLASPGYSAQDSGFQHQRVHQRTDSECGKSVETGLMEVDTAKASPRVTQNDSNGSLTASDEPQKSATATDQGSEFEKILDVVEEAGFESIDMMAAQYYTANFAPNSTSQLAQANSRSRGLRRLLQTLQNASRIWSKQQRQVYKEEIVRSAKSICLGELRVFRERQAERPRRPTTYRTESAPDSSINSDGSLIGHLNCCRAGTVGQQRQTLLKEKEFSQKKPAQQEKRLLRQCLPETWSLLSELAWGCAYDFPPAQGSQMVYNFLHYVTTVDTISITV